ncbi:MAG: hypothetical protein ACRD4F_06255, partial [Candidatus Angelobacter sp.]
MMKAMKAGLIFCAPLIVAVVVAGCVISPRREVSSPGGPSPTPTITPGGTPSPTPTPTVFPTPTITPSPTPTPTPAAGMSLVFAADPGGATISGTRINPDGSRSPVQGSPFPVAEAPQQLVALGANLLVRNSDSIVAYRVDRETGSIMQTGFAPSPAVRDIAATPSDSTVYALDDSAVSAYRLKNGKLQLLPGPL